jgi:nucleoside diphosphate kinase
MRTQAEIRERLEHWRSVLDGVLKGEETKKTIRQIIGELEWVLAEKGKARQNAELDL